MEPIFFGTGFLTNTLTLAVRKYLMSSIQTIDPTTEELIANYDLMSRDEAMDRVQACHDAFTSWQSVSHADRSDVLRKIASELRDNSDKLAALMTQETGKLLRDGSMEVELCAAIFEYTAEHGPKMLADEERTHAGGEKSGMVAYCPIGVVYSIQPWNFPVYQPVRVLAANLCWQRRHPETRGYLHR